MSAAGFLQIRNVVKEFAGHRAVNDVSIDIAKGEVFALLGSSGCGKTTLLRMLAGFETPTSGSITLDGRDLTGLAPFERPLNMMFQSYALFPHLTVGDNVAFGLRREGMPADRVSARVDEMLKLVRLEAFAKRKPHQLSGGQQQRVALARSLAKKPQLLLLDEPLGALDKKLREQTQIELANIIADVGVTCVMVTHDQQEAMTMATRIAVMSEGRFEQVGTPAEIYERPTSVFVADFIGDANIVAGDLIGSDASNALFATDICRFAVAHSSPSTAPARGMLVLRPEKIRLSRERWGGGPTPTPAPAPWTIIAPGPAQPVSSTGVDEGSTDLNLVRGTVRHIAYFGSHRVYHLTLPNGQELTASPSHIEASALAPLANGDEVWASWSTDAASVIAC